MTANQFFAALFQALHDFGLGFLLTLIPVLLLAIVAELMPPPKPQQGRHRLEDLRTQRLPELPRGVRDGMAR